VPAFPGKRLGVYELEEEIGRGSMGVVYRGRQMTLDRVVAVKVLLESLVSDESFVARFIREARLVASLNHPHIVHVYDAGRSEDLLFFAMEYVNGPTVTQLLKQKGKLPVAQVAEIGAQVAAALEYAHVEARMVHRDIKPENMIIDRRGNVKVVDFGLARVAGANTITRVGTVVGSLYYVSPEQLLGRQLDGRADVYALGVALYEMLTGKRPFLGKSLADLSRAILMGPLEPPSKLEPAIPAGLEAILLKALERDREQRYASAGAFEADLRHWIASTSEAERKLPVERAAPEAALPVPEQKAPALPTERKSAAQQTPAINTGQPTRWSSLGRPRGDPSLPPITLRSLPESAIHRQEPEPLEEEEEGEEEEEHLVEEAGEQEDDSTTSDLLKSAATHLQRLVWRLKKE
jgi:serine/threonine protein kinase